jgi:hypothetical protein
MILDPKNLPPFSHKDDWLRIFREFLKALSLRKKHNTIVECPSAIF